uniref:Beta-1,4-N-acetylgalactosaminyltransferase n=1 Tax=Meloidogyne hapla TaxID=6305 RepID=A0A1I8B8F6_MELHA
MRTSIFSICSLAVCLRRIILLSVVSSLVYLVLWNFTFPSEWHENPMISIDERPIIDLTEENNSNKLDNLLLETAASKSILMGSIKSEEVTGSQLQHEQLEHSPSQSEYCPELENNNYLKGRIGQATLLIEELEEWEVANANTDLDPGGSWKPLNCTPRHKMAVIIPYRDRKSHLVRLLDFLIPLLKRQFLDFRFIVTEQNGDNLFNKGRIMNAAFLFAQQKLNVNCVVFHDVDMFPQDDRTPYECPIINQPRHLGAFVSSLGYQLWYKEIVGGALAININDYLRVNGFSNSYWAWGGEDDDMGKRILSNNFTIGRPNSDYVRFSMLKHVKRKRVQPKRCVDIRPLYYHLIVDVGDPPSDWNTK